MIVILVSLGLSVDVFRDEKEEHGAAHRFSLDTLVAESLAPVLGHLAEHVSLRYTFSRGNDPEPFEGPPRLVNLRSGYGEVYVRALFDGVEQYGHKHTVRALLGPPLARRLRELEPDVPSWSFQVDYPALNQEEVVPDRPTPHVEGVAEVDISGPSRRPPLSVRKMADPEIGTVDPARLGIEPDDLGAVTVLLTPDVQESLATGLRMSNEIEEGGFLSGEVWRVAGEAEKAEKYVVLVRNVTPAEHSGASLTHFTFTGDSFQAMNQALAGYADGELLLGWYHSHLFSLTDLPGLSTVDVDLHFRTFRRPWQVAGLINIAANGSRLVRFFSRVENEMKECGQWVHDERGQYSAVRPSMGHS